MPYLGKTGYVLARSERWGWHRAFPILAVLPTLGTLAMLSRRPAVSR